MSRHIRIARPVGDLGRSVDMYVLGLGLRVLDRFDDHAGFDGVMLGQAGWPFHFEFTRRRSDPVTPSPSAEDLVVVYLPDRREWAATCERMRTAGFVRTTSSNPYWERCGQTFVDPDGYRVVVQNDEESVTATGLPHKPVPPDYFPR